MQTSADAPVLLPATLPVTDPRFFDSTPPRPTLAVSVIVPVRNEAHHLTQTLDALRNQCRADDGRPVDPTTYEVLLLANNCTDQSYAVAFHYQQQHPDFQLYIAQIQLSPAQANIGTVRRLLMDEACRRLMSVGNPRGIIASTDGDTVVDSYWIHYTLREIADGSDAVGGRILTRPDQSHMRLYHLRDVLYRTLVSRTEAVLDPCPHDPWPRHFQHFGASIAVTCQMYRQAGGLPEQPFLEDEAFYQALLRTDAKIRQSPHVKVVTSTRTQGRVAVGFSEQLRYWSAMSQSNQCQLAEPAEAVIRRLQNRRTLRHCWQQRQTDETTICTIAAELMVDANWLAGEVRNSLFFGQLWTNVAEQMNAGPWAMRWQPAPIITEIQALRAFLKQ